METKTTHLDRQTVLDSETYCSISVALVISFVLFPVLGLWTFMALSDELAAYNKSYNNGFNVALLPFIAIFAIFIICIVGLSISMYYYARHPEDYCLYNAKIVSSYLVRRNKSSHIECIISFKDENGNIINKKYTFSAKRYTDLTVNLEDYEMPVGYDAKRNRFIVLNEYPY